METIVAWSRMSFDDPAPPHPERLGKAKIERCEQPDVRPTAVGTR